MVASLIKLIYNGAEEARLGIDKEPHQRLNRYISQYNAPRQGRATTQWVRLDFITPPDFGKTASVSLLRKGHFIRRIFLATTLPNLDADRVALGANTPQFGYTNSIGHAILEEVNVDIGGARIDTLNSQLLEFIDERYTPLEKVPTVNRLIGRSDTDIGAGIPSQELYIPLPFWFTNSAAMALPIDTISKDEVRVNVTFRPLTASYYTQSRTNGSLTSLDAPTYYNGDVPVGVGRPLSMHNLGDTYLLVEYIYVDSPEANRFRLADLKVPIRTHYITQPYQTEGRTQVQIPIRISNPVKNIHFFAQRVEAAALNAHFLATRDISSTTTIAPWWPDAFGLGNKWEGTLRPAFMGADSEPFSAISLKYHGSLLRYGSEAPVQFRSMMPLMHGAAKTAWHNRYYYTIPFGESTANYDKIERSILELQMSPIRGQLKTTVAPQYNIYIFAETTNILRIYGGRAGLLF